MVPLLLVPSKFILSVEVLLEPTVPKLLILLPTRRFLCDAVPEAPVLVPDSRDAPLCTTTLFALVVPFRRIIWPVRMVTVGVEPDGRVAVEVHDDPSNTSHTAVATVPEPQLPLATVL